MRLPDFLVIGAAKSGTTSLHHYLAAHPEIAMSRVKEPDFFLAEGNWNRGVSWYASQFAPDPRTIAAGEVSPRYSMHPAFPGVPERIHSVLPGARFIYVIRDPLTRLRSHYFDWVLQAGERRPIDQVIMEEPRFLAASCYAAQIEQYLRFFDLDRFLIVRSDDLLLRTDVTLGQIFRFLGARESLPLTRLEQHNRTDRTYPARPALRKIVSGRLFKALLTHMPPGIKHHMRPLVTAPPSVDDVISDGVLEHVRRVLVPDLTRLETYLEVSLEGWFPVGEPG